jgi:ATP synthase I chain
MTEAETEGPDEVLRRVRRLSIASYFVFAVPILITTGWHGLLGLTCSAVVTMINFLWLERIAEAILQPSPRLRPWRLSVRALARYVLLVAALSVTIVIARFNVVSVLLGFSIIVVGIMGEAAYTLFRRSPS